MRALLRFVLFSVLVCALRAADPVLKVSGPGQSVAFTAAEFAALPHTELTVTDPHSKAERRFGGVVVRDLLARVGAPFGEKLRGPALALAVVVHSKDGYAVVFSLADFDDTLSPRTVLLADTEEGKALAENAAPFRLIVPGDKKGARWARLVTALEIVPLTTKP